MKFQLVCVLVVLAIYARAAAGDSTSVAQAIQPGEEVLIAPGDMGYRGGRLVAALHTDPKTLNPVVVADAYSKELISLLFSDLIHINLSTERTEPALAKAWKVSSDGRRYTLELRHGIKFSDGHPFDADDVVFSFNVYLDDKVHSPQRDLLQVGGKPIEVRKAGPYRVIVDLPQPYAAAERLFDNVSILPKHLLENAYKDGIMATTWNLAADPKAIAGLGPFRLKQYTPGQQIVLERNPFYWKADAKMNRLPYLDEIAFVVVPTEDAEVIRFQSGDVDVIERISAENYAVLEKEQQARGYHLYDLGPGFEYNFLFFNLNDLSGKDLPQVKRKQEWFRQDAFRQAVSAAIDRDAIVRLVYQGRATPLWNQVTPANKLWIDAGVPHPPRSLEKARALLRSAGFTGRADGTLADAHGETVEFTIVTNPSNAQRSKIAAIIQDDLSQLGMQVRVVPLEFHSIMTRVLESFDYEASVLGLASGDADPNPEINFWSSTGASHLWAQKEPQPIAPWQAEIDRLMERQTAMLDYKKRKQAYDRVQELVANYEPVICVVSPNILVGAKASLAGLKPSVMRNYLLWDAEQIFWQKQSGEEKRQTVVVPPSR